VAESDEELLTFDVSDDALERAAPVVGGQGARFLNQNFPSVPNSGKMCFTPRPKIVLQHNRVKSGH
jgi:hypothetical protein